MCWIYVQLHNCICISVPKEYGSTGRWINIGLFFLVIEGWNWISSICFLPWLRVTMTGGGGEWGGTQKGRCKAGRQVICLSQMQVLEKRICSISNLNAQHSSSTSILLRDGNLRWHPPMVAGALALLCQKWLCCPCASCSVQLWLLAWRLCVGGCDVDEHGFQLALGWVGPDAWCYHTPS